jgi:hypothetical protein
MIETAPLNQAPAAYAKMMAGKSLHGSAIDILHDEIVWADVVESADIRVIQGSDSASLTLKAVGELLLGGFDRDDTV